MPGLDFIENHDLPLFVFPAVKKECMQKQILSFFIMLSLSIGFGGQERKIVGVNNTIRSESVAIQRNKSFFFVVVWLHHS